MKLLNDLILGENRGKGFTLIELLIALIIFSIGIVGAARLHTAGVSGNAYSMQLTQAISVAQNQAERLQDIDFTEAGVHDGTADDLETPGNAPRTGTVFRDTQNVTYTPSWTVQPINTNYKLLQVNMRVNWNEKATPRQYSMTFCTGIN
jgi:prepilin-type N-terminal cleavage/methylation domain-containing protein